MSTGMEPYLALILLGFLPSEVWRWLGLLARVRPVEQVGKVGPQ